MAVVKYFFPIFTEVSKASVVGVPAPVNYTGFVLCNLVLVTEVFWKTTFAVNTIRVGTHAVAGTTVVQIVLHYDFMQARFQMRIGNFGTDKLLDFLNRDLTSTEPDC